MDLLSDAEKAAYAANIDDLHDTFGRDIYIINETEVPVDAVPEEDDNFDFVNDRKKNPQKFTMSSTRVPIKARIEYIEKQDQQYLFLTQYIPSFSSLGAIRIKVKLVDAPLVEKCNFVEVDGLVTTVGFRDQRHGLFSPQYATFFVGRGN